MIRKNCYKYIYFAHILDYLSDLQKKKKNEVLHFLYIHYIYIYIYKILFEVILLYNYNDKFLFQVSRSMCAVENVNYEKDGV